MVRRLEFDPRTQSETSSGREHHNSAITAVKYRFTLAGKSARITALAAIPKRKK